jgi:3-oxoadipate enol-lactonase
MSGRVVDVDGCPLYVRVDGHETAPALMLCNSLGTDLHLWDPQTPEWAKSFRVVRYDRRGHGRSGLGHAPRIMDTLGRDALAIMDALGLDKVHWCGLSMGGMVGQWLGANAPERINKLILSNTSAYFADKQRWNDRIKAIREGGLDAVAYGIMNIWFSADFRARAPETVAHMRAMLCEMPIEGYIASCESVRDMDLRPLLPKITAPTLIVAGSHDQSTPLPMAEFLRDNIKDATFRVMDTAHIANVEQPSVYTDMVLKFLTDASR